MPVRYDFASAEFDDAVSAAGRRAFDATLAAGLPVFYLDGDGLNLMEQPDGRKFCGRDNSFESWQPRPDPFRVLDLNSLFSDTTTRD